MTTPFLQTPGGAYWWASAFVDLDGIPSGEAFGSVSLNNPVRATSIVSGEVFGSVTLTYNQDITPAGIDPGDVGVPVVADAEFQVVRTDSVPSSEAFGAPALVRGPHLELLGIPSGEAFGNATIPTAPRLDSVGAGFSSATVTDNFSFSHNGTIGAYVFVDLVLDRPPSATLTVTYGGAAMSLLTSTDLANTSGWGAGKFYRYGSSNIPGGTQTVRVDWSGGALFAYTSATAQAVSYLGVTSVGSVALTALTHSATPSQTATATAGQRVVQSFGGNSVNAAAYTVSGGTNRFKSSSAYAQLAVNDSAAASTTFTATIAPTSGSEYWVGCYNVISAVPNQITVAGIPSGEGFGTLLIAPNQMIQPSSITSGEAFGTAGVLANSLLPTGIPSAEAIGAPAVVQLVAPTGIASGEAVGAAAATQIVAPTGIASGQAIGSATVTKASTLTFDAVGPGSAGSGTRSWSHTAAAGADVFVLVSIAGNVSITSVTHDGVAMTLVGNIGYNNNTGNGQTALYRRAAVAGGAKTIVVTPSAGYVTANSISFNAVGSVGTAQTVFAFNTSLSQSVTLSAGQVAIQGFGAGGGGSSMLTSVSGGTNRYNSGVFTTDFGGTYYADLTVSTATATATFTATNSTNTNWSGIAVVLT